MSKPPSNTPSASARFPAASAEVHWVQEVLRFVRAVRYRKGTVFVALAGSCLLGGLYYATADRVYESEASLLVLQTGSDTWSTPGSGDKVSKNLMVTYRDTLQSEVVLEKAVARLQPEHRADLEGVPQASWADVLRSSLKVTVARDAHILEIAYRSKAPEAAAAVTDAILSAYLEFMNDLHQNTTGELLKILTEEKQSLEKELQAGQDALLDARSNAGELVIREGKNGINAAFKRVMSLNQSLIAAREKRLQAQSQSVSVEEAVRNGEDLQQHAVAMIDSVGREVFLQRLGLGQSDAQTISRINHELLQSRAKLQSALQIYGPVHRQVIEIQERIREAQDYLQNRRHSEIAQLQQIRDQELAPMLLAMAQQQLRQTIEHERAVRQSYDQEKQAAIELDSSMAQLEIAEIELSRLRGLYDVILQRMRDVDLGQESGTLKTKVLSRPEIPLGAVSPRLMMVAMLSLMLGLAVGSAVVWVQDLLDDHFRSPEELQTQLGLPMLAMIRRMEPLADVGVGVAALHVFARPNAAETEPFRTLRTALALAEGGVQRLVVSSSEAGDGKTTVVANLAAAFAKSGKRTLLIDADLRRPGLTPLLNLRGQRGLSALLRLPEPVADAARQNRFESLAENLDVIPSGPRPINPTELLAGDRFSELLSWAESQYDQVLIDSPPALVSDTAIIGRLVDGVLLTVEPRKNRRRLVMRAAESFALLGINVLGIVVNRLAGEDEKDSYGYGYGYEYTYSYGHDEAEHDEDGPSERARDRSSRIVRRAA